MKASRKMVYDKLFKHFGTRPLFTQKLWHTKTNYNWYSCISLRKMFGGEYQVHDKEKVFFCHIALNLYFGTNVLVYERWLVLKVWYTAGRPAKCFCHYIRLTLLIMLMHVSQKLLEWIDPPPPM